MLIATELKDLMIHDGNEWLVNVLQSGDPASVFIKLMSAAISILPNVISDRAGLDAIALMTSAFSSALDELEKGANYDNN